ncbi:MAG: hypothetical protein WC323_02470 [Patescibacteria group bacterium]|jgi:hypothetical protein
MIYFTKYADKKFDVLNKHGVFITKEEIEDVIKLPKKTQAKGKYLHIEKLGIKVIMKKEGDLNKVVTFYPIKS